MSARSRTSGWWRVVCLLAVASVACARERREFRPPPPRTAGDGFDDSAYAITEGSHLFEWFNCVGCHGHGGGGMGPPLMSGGPIHGNDPGIIFTIIVDGTPNGMPGFGGRIADEQVWQLVAYVRALRDLAPSDAVAAREDHMQYRTSAAAPTRDRAAETLHEMRAAEDAQLSTYGWVNRPAGIVHIPIRRAMDLIAERGVRPTRPAPAR